eukprot:15358654-Ditylum_brightwellii.AAC.3
MSPLAYMLLLILWGPGTRKLQQKTPVQLDCVQKIKACGIADANSTPEVHCKCFEDNSGTLELARLPKMPSHTKHINLVWHHFWDYFRKKFIHIIPVKSEYQPVDIMMKSVEQNGFVNYCNFLMG